MARLSARVDQIDPGGMALVGPGGRYWVNWPLLGLSEAKTHWRLRIGPWPERDEEAPNYYIHYTI